MERIRKYLRITKTKSLNTFFDDYYNEFLLKLKMDINNDYYNDSL